MEKYKEINFGIHLRLHQDGSEENLMACYHFSVANEVTALDIEKAIKAYFISHPKISTDELGAYVAKEIGGTYSIIPLHLSASLDIKRESPLKGQTSLLN